MTGVVIGVDIGTTSTKAVAFDTGGHPLASHAVAYPLHEPAPGYAEQDPDEIYAAVLETTRQVVARVGTAVAGLSFSSADSRAAEQAERLRASPGGLELHRRTGTPMHPMSPLPKLVWFREQEPQLCKQVGHWVGIKDYVLAPLCDVLVTDHSLASATGLPADTPVVVGAGDGPLANLGIGIGIGAVRQGGGGLLDRNQRRCRSWSNGPPSTPSAACSATRQAGVLPGGARGLQLRGGAARHGGPRPRRFGGRRCSPRSSTLWCPPSGRCGCWPRGSRSSSATPDCRPAVEGNVRTATVGSSFDTSRVEGSTHALAYEGLVVTEGTAHRRAAHCGAFRHRDRGPGGNARRRGLAVRPEDHRDSGV